MASYLFIILLIVSFFEIFFIVSVRQYYHVNIKNTLTQQAETAVSGYNQVHGTLQIGTDYREIISLLGMNTNSLIELYDKNGSFIADNTAEPVDHKLKPKDVEEALSGKTGFWTGIFSNSAEDRDGSAKVSDVPELGNGNPLDSEPAMSVSIPLKNQGNIEGAARFVTSLSYVDKIINHITLILVIFGIAIVILSFIISILLSNSIINPVKSLTASAQSFASGDFSIKAPKKYNDEIGQLSDTFNYMTEKIKENEKIKNEFIASISHDLRTPLTSIKGWAITLLKGDLTNREELVEGLNIISSESGRLNVMVQELLDFSKFEAGKVTLNKTLTDLNCLCENIVKQLTPRAKRQGIDIFINICPGLPCVKIDEYRIKQVVLNVLDNSLKFTPKDGQIEVNLSKSDNDAIISITDSGCGISRDDMPHITKKFYKSKSSTGSGLGLAIAGEIVELHEGALDIQSTEGHGTNIVIKLPL
jgi:signal transduction histidine kinase